MAPKGPNPPPSIFDPTPPFFFFAPPTLCLALSRPTHFSLFRWTSLCSASLPMQFIRRVPFLFQVTAGAEADPVRAEAGIRSAPFTPSWRWATSGKMSGEGCGDTIIAQFLLIHNRKRGGEKVSQQAQATLSKKKAQIKKNPNSNPLN